MVILLKTASVRVSSIQIMQVRVQNKGKSVWKSRYDGDVPVLRRADASRRERLKTRREKGKIKERLPDPIYKERGNRRARKMRRPKNDYLASWTP